MTRMKVVVNSASDREASTVLGDYLPNLAVEFGTQIGTLNGFEEGLISLSKVQGSPSALHPVQYVGEPKFLKIGCPLFEGALPAITFGLDVKYHSDYTYPPSYDDWLVEIANRLVAIFAPEDNGQFRVLFVQSDPDDLEQLDEVESRRYEYENELNNPAGSFSSVVSDVMQFLTKNKPD